MSVNIPTFYVEQFSTNINLLTQQMDSRFAGAVMVGSHQGKQASVVDQIGAVAAQKVTSRFEDMPRVDAPTDRRWVFPVDYDLPQLVDTLDKLRLVTDPTSALVTNAVAAMQRAMDDQIISAFFADAKTGETGSTTTSFPTSTTTNVVSVDTGGSASGLNVAKLRAARKMLRKAEVNIDAEQPYIAITADQEDDLLNEIQVINRDYNSTLVLQNGKIDRYLGFEFIHSERLTTGTDDQSGTSTEVPVWVRSGMHLGVWDGISTTISQRNDLRSLPFQAYVAGTFGATRVEEKKVLKIWCR